jgi:hypothetical protein
MISLSARTKILAAINELKSRKSIEDKEAKEVESKILQIQIHSKIKPLKTKPA